MNIDIDIDINKVMKGINNKKAKIEKAIKDSMAELGDECSKHAQDTVSSFRNSKGYPQGVNTGNFVASIHSEPINDGFGFKMSDGVNYGIYHEFGTIKHWVPFYDRSGNITPLGLWALQHFSLDGTFQVIGRRGKSLKAPSRKSREDRLKAMGGIMVSLDEMAPFRKALEYCKSITNKIFKEHLNGIK